MRLMVVYVTPLEVDSFLKLRKQTTDKPFIGFPITNRINMKMF